MMYDNLTTFEDAAASVPYPAPAGVDASGGAAASIFDSFTSAIGSLGATAANLRNAITANSLANIQNQATVDIAKANAQAAVIKAGQAANPGSSQLMIVLAIVGVGLAFFSYAKH